MEDAVTDQEATMLAAALPAFIAALAALWSVRKASVNSRELERFKADSSREFARLQQDAAERTAANLWRLDANQQLRMFAAEKRLATHQKAFAMWRRAFRKIHQKEAAKEFNKCIDWWEENALYLDPKAREAFIEAVWAAHQHPQILEAWRGRPGGAEHVEKNWQVIQALPNVILECVDQPALTMKAIDSLLQAGPFGEHANGEANK